MHSARHRARSRAAVKDPDPDPDPDRDPDAVPPGRRDRVAALRAARSVWPMDRQAAATLPGGPESVSTARRFLRITAAMWRLGGELVDDAELCISELVGNAVTHTDSRRVHCRIWSARQMLFLEVDDEGRGRLPDVAPAKEEDEHGRGMMLVESFAEAWGTAPRPGLSGKTVWAALPMPAALGIS
ncbi:ATP-binding protein [Peterkaempfera bronchialis]|uniref:ATP-binding protein n=1 Tax=Peterkaempfera bronchialis TaxID=2126346 RepID=UPI003C2E6B54